MALTFSISPTMLAQREEHISCSANLYFPSEQSKWWIPPTPDQ